ncbi:MAG: ATP phosphoribosyltransferase [Candidatus Entotheonellia bacterium]
MKPGLTIALPKGRLFRESVALLEKIHCSAEGLGEGRRLVFEDAEQQTRFLILRPVDIPTYVEYGAADVGIVGKDVIDEGDRDVYEPLDLKFGRCRLVVAQPGGVPQERSLTDWSYIRVASKFPRITERYYNSKGVPVEIIRLSGSIELAPLVGLCERIVDLVETGQTLAENGLVEVGEIMRVTARLIVNRASQKTKYEQVSDLIGRLKQVI